MSYRQIHTKIWQDAWFLDLLPEEKLLFVYLFSNERASLCGLYELSLKTMSFETGLRNDAITLALHRFELAGKAFYDPPLIWVPNLRKYNANRSPKVQAKVASELQAIPDCALKRRYDTIDTTPPGLPADTVSGRTETVSRENVILRQEQEQEHEQQHEQEQKASTSRPDGRKPADFQPLLDAFVKITGIPMPELKTARQRSAAGALWFSPLREMLHAAGSVERADKAMRLAVREMRHSRLTIATPGSILKTAISELGKMNHDDPVRDPNLPIKIGRY